MMDCLVGGCEADGCEHLAVDSTGMILVYTICAEHLSAVLNGQMLPQAVEINRGLIGPARPAQGDL
ncbi:hypothetical protein B7R22_17300 [Subtercola boreus]|uniref:Uncharacterized protein n=1 Tax=Subtercola boreus TaxID=120213 RepID=A0A3E0VQB2_9MICO|nr:hypothetical protein B7R22_17300 [Subtercola boreus]